MKKISLLMLALTAGFGFTVMAQETEGGKDFKPLRTPMSTDVRFGLKAGVNMASINADDDNSTEDPKSAPKTSFNAGLFVNIPIGSSFRIQPEVSYSGQGSKIGGSFGPLTGDYEIDIHYINIPVTLQYQTMGGIWLEAGPQVGFMIKDQYEDPNGNEFDLPGDLKKTDFSINGGVGYLTRIGLGFGARYNLGLSNLFDEDNGQHWRNRVLSFNLVYHFGASK